MANKRDFRAEALRQEQASVALSPDRKTREAWLAEVSNFLQEYIDRIDDIPTYFPGKAEQKSEDFKKPAALSEILNTYQKNVIEKGITASSGGHLGYIPGGGIYTASLGDLIAAVTNEYAGVVFGSPGAVAIEQELIDWMIKVFGFPAGSGGNLTSGGSIANLIALTTARDVHNVKNETIPNAVVYLSEQAHHCIKKALKIIGLGDVIVRHVPLNQRHQIQTTALAEMVEKDKKQGLQPFLIVASAGTTDTGAMDPLEAIAEIAEKEKLWFHVDGAYGGFFILTDEKKALFKGIERADSLVIDPHKSLFLPYGSGAVLVKNKQAVIESHHYMASYMQDAYALQEEYSPADLSPELTKHFRGLRMWVALKLHGIEPFRAALEEKILLTHYFMDEIQEKGFKVGPEPELSVGYFYFPAKDRYGIADNLFNEYLLKCMMEDGETFFSSTLINEKFVIRIAVLSFRTHVKTIDKGIAMIERTLEKTVKHFGK